MEAVFEQTMELVPVTVYTVVVPGLTVMLAAVAPVFHR
jgi:precorrin-4 methylase